MFNRKILTGVLGATLLGMGLSTTAVAADGAALFKSKTCVACHGAEGRKPILPIYPKLAGQNEQYMLEQMKDIKSGARANGQAAAMKGVMHLVSEEEMQAIAAYLAGLK